MILQIGSYRMWNFPKIGVYVSFKTTFEKLNPRLNK